MADGLARILYDPNGNAIKVTQDGSDYKYEFIGKLRDSSGTIVNPAKEDTLAAIKDTDGIKKIVDQLPPGTNEIGKVAQGTKASASGAWPEVIVDSSGNYIGVVLDDVVYRFQTDSKIAKKITAGTLEHLRVLDDTGALKSTLYTADGSAISFPNIATDPDGIANDFARQSGGTDDSDLRVDGSTTPVDFTFDSLGSGEDDLVIQSIGFVMVANSIISGSGKFAGLSKLTNGVGVIYKEEGSEIEIATIVENECFMHFASVGGYNFWALNKDQLQSYYFVGGAVILHAGHNDSVIVRISDDLSSGLDYFKCQIKAINRG